MAFIAPALAAVAGRVVAPMVARAGSRAAFSAATRMGGGRFGQFMQGQALNAAAGMEKSALSGAAANAGMYHGYTSAQNNSSQRQNFDQGIDAQSMYGGM